VKGGDSPSFFEMIKKNYIAKLANDCLLDTDRFIAGIVISTDNVIKVFIDGDTGVTIKNCIEVSRYIESSLDREDEDFEISVSSAGLDHPFVLLRQYINNYENTISIIKTDGVKIKGILKNATDDTVELLEEIQYKNKKKKSITYGEVITIPMIDIKETKRVITF
jgi:ribosome maturation factor RimP